MHDWLVHCGIIHFVYISRSVLMTSNAFKLKVNLISLQINYLKLHWGCQSDSLSSSEVTYPSLSWVALDWNCCWLSAINPNRSAVQDNCICNWHASYNRATFFLCWSLPDKMSWNVFSPRLLRSWVTLTQFWSTGDQWKQTTLAMGAWFWPGQWLWKEKNKIVLFVGHITQSCGQEFENSSSPVQFKNRIHVLFMPPPV